MSSDRVIHMIQFLALLTAGTILILFGHDYVPPLVVFTSLIASTASLVGARIVANGYIANQPTQQPVPSVQVVQAAPAPPTPPTNA